MSENFLHHMQGFLFDLDGVFYVDEQSIPGGAATIAHLEMRQIPYRFVTNNTCKSLDALHKKLVGIGLPARREQIFTSRHAGVMYLRQLGKPRCFLLVPDEIRPEFAEFPQDDKNPEVVVIGDLGEHWTYALLNKAFGMIMAGAQLLALHKNKYWQTAQGLRMDVGAFIVGLEYITGKTAVVVGKPAVTYFDMALKDIGLKAERVAMIGDDIEADIAGAQEAGMKGILVKTGKYRPELIARSPVRADLVIESVASLQGLV
jgi:HAD superfamily hydrolase (TIGR01458 family)